MESKLDTLHTQIKGRFGDDLDDSLLSECASVCQMNNISGDDLWFRWEAIRYNNNGYGATFDTKSLREVKIALQKVHRATDRTKKFARDSLSGTQSRKLLFSGQSSNRLSLRGPLGTPAKPVVRPQDGFDILRMEEKKVSIAGPSRVTYVGPPAAGQAREKRVYRYMYEKVSERSEVLDDRIDHFGELVKAYYDVEELGDPSAVTEEEVVVVGRVTLDAESSTSGPIKLNEASLMLESSRMMGSGARVPLRFDKDNGVKIKRGKRGLGGQGFFPGAIVALKGKNGGGGSFLATEILSLPPLESPSSALIKSETGETHFSMHIACGPFTHDADLQFRPLQNLFTKLKSTKPAVVLLIGPFIDAMHPSIKIGDVDSTPAEMFRTEFLDRLHDFVDASPGSLVLLVPSPRDILSGHAVFPQCELPQSLCNDLRIRLLPNPARFTLNGVHFAVSSVDVLFHLRKEEFFKRGAEAEPLAGPADPEGQSPSDAMANLCRHVLQQRSFYPIFPVPQDVAHEVNLDVTHSEQLYLCPQDDGDGAGEDPSRPRCAPDVLILPSKLKHFSKIVDNTVAVNPSFLWKSTYAMLEYAGHTIPSPAKDRLKVEIARLEG